MTRYLIPAIFLATAALISPAMASGVANVQWCEQDTHLPARGAAWSQRTPDGGIRGPRSAAQLIGHAREAARAGRDNEAIEWALVCQYHNAGAADQIRADREAVLRYLRG